VVPGVRLGRHAALGWSPSGSELYVAGTRGRVLAYTPGADRARAVGPRFEDPIMQLLPIE